MLGSIPTIVFLFGALALGLNGCFNGPGLYQQEDPGDQNLAILAKDSGEGVVSGGFSAASGVTQSLAASSDGEIAGSSVAFPSGSLPIDTDITLQQGGSFAGSNVGSALGVGAMAAAGPSVVINSSADIDANSAFTLQIPSGGAGLLLNDDDARTVVIFKYRVAADDKLYLGLIPRSAIKIENNFVVFKTKYFGAYQAAITETLVEEEVRVDSNTPILTKVEENKLEAIEWTFGKATYSASKREVDLELAVTGFSGDVLCSAFVHTDKAAAAIKIDTMDEPEPQSSLDGYNYTPTLTTAHTIFIRFECTDAGGRTADSPWSEKITVPAKEATLTPTPTPVSLPNVSGFAVDPFSRITVIASWDSVTNTTVTGYRLAYSSSASPANCKDAGTYTDLPSRQDDFKMLRKLTPATTYFFRLCSKDGNGNYSSGVTASAATDSGNQFSYCAETSNQDTTCTIGAYTVTDSVFSFSGDVIFTGDFSGTPTGDIIFDVGGDFSTTGGMHAVNVEIFAKNVFMSGSAHNDNIGHSGGLAGTNGGIGVGDGGGGSAGGYGGGGAHYGAGGSGVGSATGGSVNFDLDDPFGFGSGGGRGSNQGANGGGYFVVIAEDLIQITGGLQVSAYGWNAYTTGDGGGAGGTIWLQATTITPVSSGGSFPILDVSGGDGDTGGGGGGGGVIRIEGNLTNSFQYCYINGGSATSGGVAGSAGYADANCE